MTHSSNKNLLALLFSLLAPLLFVACNTMEGLGQDTQAAGEAIEDQADEEEEEDARGDN